MLTRNKKVYDIRVSSEKGGGMPQLRYYPTKNEDNYTSL